MIDEHGETLSMENETNFTQAFTTTTTEAALVPGGMGLTIGAAVGSLVGLLLLLVVGVIIIILTWAVKTRLKRRKTQYWIDQSLNHGGSRK